MSKLKDSKNSAVDYVSAFEKFVDNVKQKGDLKLAGYYADEISKIQSSLIKKGALFVVGSILAVSLCSWSIYLAITAGGLMPGLMAIISGTFILASGCALCLLGGNIVGTWKMKNRPEPERQITPEHEACRLLEQSRKKAVFPEKWPSDEIKAYKILCAAMNKASYKKRHIEGWHELVTLSAIATFLNEARWDDKKISEQGESALVDLVASKLFADSQTESLDDNDPNYFELGNSRFLPERCEEIHMNTGSILKEYFYKAPGDLAKADSQFFKENNSILANGKGKQKAKKVEEKPVSYEEYVRTSRNGDTIIEILPHY